MAEHNAPFSHIAYQHPDGTTGVLDNHDAEAIHDGTATVKAQNLEDGSVTNGKLAPKSVTEAELADGSVTAAVIADGAVAKEKLSPEMQESWDSLSQDGKQSGSERADCQANSTVDSAVITFPRAYKFPPLVIVDQSYDELMTPETAADMEFTPFSITETGFRVRVRNGGAFMHAGKFDWQAYGILA